MPVPARRHSKTRQRIRRSHHQLDKVNVTNCSHCQTEILPHVACPACGYYKGRVVLNVVRQVERLQKRMANKLRSKSAPDETHDHDHDHDHDHEPKTSKPVEVKKDESAKPIKEVSKARRLIQRKKPE